jgi:hypothetical protein
VLTVVSKEWGLIEAKIKNVTILLIRFKNEEIYQNAAQVAEKIREFLNKMNQPTSPKPPRKEGGQFVRSRRLFKK